MTVFDNEIAGHDAWKRYFERELARDRTAHAYLFSGPQAVGKWTFACAVAKRVICNMPADATACGRCSPCLRFAAGAHPDIQQIDAVAEGARGLGVEEARARVVGAFRLKPSEARLRAVIINDADKMEPQAQNALLKTLEEPPPRSLLILVASDASSLLETVISRCFLLRFSTVPDAAFAEYLARRGAAAAEISNLVTLAAGHPGRALALEREGGKLIELAKLFLSAGAPPLQVSKGVQEAAADQGAKSAFERRRQAVIAFCAALASELRERVARDPERASTQAIERVCEAASEVEASATPEVVIDRLLLDLAHTRVA